MNNQQKKAVDIAIAGHNLLLIGEAGTGKSYVVQHIQDSLRAQGKRMQITCATGIACSIYDDACTLHRFLGLGDGRFGPSEVNAVHCRNACCNYVDKNLDKTDCLIVDKCSMISQRTFEIMFSVCGKKETPVQTIFCGDFLQLPPVPNERYADYGEYCFDSGIFMDVFPHNIVLDEVFRATDPELVKANREVFSLQLSDETEAFILSLNRPLVPPYSNDSVKLFATNHLVADYNRKCLLEFPGEVFEHLSTDLGDQGVLDKMIAPHTLWLKNGCPVILLQNLSDKLFNGLRGYVQSIATDGITVTFPTVNITRRIPVAKFTGRNIVNLLLKYIYM